MVELIFVRHAPTSWSGRRYCGRADPALNRVGERLAGRVGAELAAAAAARPGAGPRIISSPLRRARQTAHAIALAIHAPDVDVDPRWAEADVGIAEGRTFEALSVLDPGLTERLARGDVAIDWPDGESASSLAERVACALRDLRAATGPTIVVSHAGPLRIAIALATGIPTDRVAWLEPSGWLSVTGVEAAIPEHRGKGGRMLRFRA